MKKILIFCLIILITVGFLMGCTSAPPKSENRSRFGDYQDNITDDRYMRDNEPNWLDDEDYYDMENNEYLYDRYNGMNDYYRQNDYYNGSYLTPNNNMTKSSKIENTVENMSEFRDADCVISGDTAYVGCEGVNGDISEKLKERTVSRIKSLYPEIKKVYISNDPDITNKITNLRKDMNNMSIRDNDLIDLDNLFR